MKSSLMLILSFCLVFAASDVLGADKLYLSTAGGNIVGLDGLPQANSGIGGAGDTSFGNFSVGGGVSQSCITVGNTGAYGTQVLIGSEDGIVSAYDTGLTWQDGWNTNGDGNPVTAIAAGSFGTLGNAVIAANGARGGGTTVLVGDYDLNYQGHIGAGEEATGIVLGEFDASRAGNELIFTTTNTVTKLKNSGLVVGGYYNPGVGSGVSDIWGWWGVNNTISDLVSTSASEFAIVGNIGGFPDGVFGPGAQGYDASGAGLPAWNYGFGLADNPATTGSLLAGDTGDILGGSGLELVMAGSGTGVGGSQLLRIIDAASGAHLQTLVTNMDVTALALADAYGDSALEIVLGTADGYLHTSVA